MIPAAVLTFFPYFADSFILPKMLVCSFLILLFWMFRKDYGYGESELPMMCLLAWIGFSSLYTGDFLMNLIGKHNSRYLGIIPLSLCLVVYLFDFKDQTRIARATAFVSAVYTIVTVQYSMFQIPNGRGVGTMGSPPMMGCALAMLFPFTKGLDMIVVLAGIAATQIGRAHV